MKKLPIPEIEQINCMINFSISELMSKYNDNSGIDLPENYITIDRSKMLEFLKKNPDRAKKCFEKIEPPNAPTHDLFKIIKGNNHFIVAMMSHGIPKVFRKFQTLEEAVTEYLFLIHGIL